MMKNELLTILFIRSSYKIRKINVPFMYYQLFQILIVVLVLGFIGLAASVVFLSQSNAALKEQMALHTLEKKLNTSPIETMLTDDVEENTNDSITTTRDETVVAAPTKISFDVIDTESFRISSVDISPSNNQLSIQFDLRNNKIGETVGGYVIISTFDNERTLNSQVNFPSSIKVNADLVPENYKSGQSFSIKRFKRVQAKLNRWTENNKLLIISIYSDNGLLEYRQNFDIQV